MNRHCHTFAIALLLCSSAQAQVFKWVGPDGKTNYSDVPPAPALKAQKKSFQGNVVDGGELPFGLEQAARANPVTLYTGAKCQPCDGGRALLTARGIPFSEKTVSSNADIALLGNTEIELPQLMVGKNKLQGFESTSWHASLTAAGYPESSALPKNYRNPAPAPAAPVATKEAGSDTAADPAATGTGRAKKPAPRVAPPKPADTTLPGLRF